LADKFRGRSEGSCWASGISRCCRLDCIVLPENWTGGLDGE
jgi:hypothetical protein